MDFDELSQKKAEDLISVLDELDEAVSENQYERFLKFTIRLAKFNDFIFEESPELAGPYKAILSHIDDYVLKVINIRVKRAADVKQTLAKMSSEFEPEFFENIIDVKKQLKIKVKKQIMEQNKLREEAMVSERNHKTDRSIHIGKVEVSGGGTVNIGEHINSVTKAINKLPDSGDGEESDLKQLLAKLQRAIENSEELTNQDKVDALEQVEEIAGVGMEPQNKESGGVVRKAFKILKGTAASLPYTAKIVEEINKLIPQISKFFE